MKKILVLLLAAAAMLLPSCGNSQPKTTPDEARVILEPLLEKSAELNEIYFGAGLPLSDNSEDVERLLASFDADVKTINYHPVSRDAKYKSIDAIKTATLEVFSDDYSAYLFERAFSGIADKTEVTTKIPVEDDKTEDYADSEETTVSEVKQVATYAMYLEQNGMLTVRLHLEDEAYPLGREYDLDSLTVERDGDGYIVVKVPTTLDGKNLDVKLKLVKEDDGWRLDSPTY